MKLLGIKNNAGLVLYAVKNQIVSTDVQGLTVGESATLLPEHFGTLPHTGFLGVRLAFCGEERLMSSR
jgi:hypothetical protein